MIKMALDIPKRMMNIARQEETQKRPYDLCLECPFISESCDGPNCLAMENERWVEWANARAKQLDLTRADMAEQSGLPLSTINSVLSGRTKDVRHSTMREITRVLIGGCWGQYPCHFAALLLMGAPLEEETSADVAALREQLARADEVRRAEIAAAKEEDQRKVDFLKQQIARKDKVITILSLSLAVVTLLVIAALIYDKINPDVGWFRDAAAMMLNFFR